MRAAIVAIAMAAALGSASSSASPPTRPPDDPVLRDVERAYGILRAARPAAAARARALLAAAAAALDDLADDRDGLGAALGGDDAAAWRGLPHERVMVLLTLAALDVDAGRCDLALPTLKNARHHRDQASLQRGEAVAADDLLLADVLRARCAIHDGVGDVDAARAALQVRPEGERLLAAVAAPALQLRFSGRAPAVTAGGAHGAVGSLAWSGDASGDPSTTAPAFLLTIGRAPRRPPSTSPSASTSSSPLVVHDLRLEARAPGPAATQRRTAQASRKQALQQQAQQYASRGQQTATQAKDVRSIVGAGLLLGAAAGLSATTAVVDTRVDTRTVSSMPAAIAVLSG
jgi:hypothetical protein